MRARPIRMCIHCKERFSQNELLRLQCKQQSLTLFNGIGRSFYICEKCKHSKSIGVSLAKSCKKNKKDKEIYNKELKEILANG